MSAQILTREKAAPFVKEVSCNGRTKLPETHPIQFFTEVDVFSVPGTLKFFDADATVQFGNNLGIKGEADLEEVRARRLDKCAKLICF
jgi:hypothetical protein